MREYPVLFVSHGSLEQAITNPEVERMFQEIRKKYVVTNPKTVIIISSQWENTDVTLTADEKLSFIDKGKYSDSYFDSYTVQGNQKLCDKICDVFVENRLTIREKRNRGLDEGSLIPLRLMFPKADIPVIQLSLVRGFNPEYHIKVAEMLRYLKRGHGILFIASGGVIGNKSVFHSQSNDQPETWVKTFESAVYNSLFNETDHDIPKKLKRLFYHDLFQKAHPTPEHFLPLLMASRIGDAPEKIYEGYQEQNCSMLSFKFD